MSAHIVEAKHRAVLSLLPVTSLIRITGEQACMTTSANFHRHVWQRAGCGPSHTALRTAVFSLAVTEVLGEGGRDWWLLTRPMGCRYSLGARLGAVKHKISPNRKEESLYLVLFADLMISQYIKINLGFPCGIFDYTSVVADMNAKSQCDP